MIDAKIFVGELVGTFILLSFVSKYASQTYGAYIIGAALTGSILLSSHLSGAHFNPAVTLLKKLSDGDDFSSTEFMSYMIAQITAVFLVYIVSSKM